MKTLAVSIVAICMMSGSATADPYKITVSGVIGFGTGPANSTRDTRGYFGGIAIGDPFSATYYYDRDMLASKTTPANTGPAQFWFPFTGASLTVNGRTLDMPTSSYNSLTQMNWSDHNGTKSQRLQLLYNFYPPNDVISVGISLVTKQTDFFDTENIAAGSILTRGETAFDLTQYSSPFAQAGSAYGNPFNGTGGSFLSLFFNPTRVEVAAVPEPETWVMMLLGFGMVAGAARYRRRGTKVAFG